MKSSSSGILACAGLLIVATLMAPTAAGAAAPVCATSSAPGGFTTTVCIAAPANGAIVSGKVPVTASVQITGTAPSLNGVQYLLDGKHWLFDFQSPYTFTLHTYLSTVGQHTLGAAAVYSGGYTTPATSVRLTFGFASKPATAPFSPTAGTNPAAGQPFTLAVAGDGATGMVAAQQVNTLLGSWNPNLVTYLGDVYQEGLPEEYVNWYGENGSYFNRFRSITDPVIGNHEYTNSPGATAYFDYWGNPPHYYSVNTHGWHIVSLDDTAEFGQGATTSAQYQWLQHDLATTTSPCILVGFHRPMYTLNPGEAAADYSAYWQLFNRDHVTLVVSGHSHNYQHWKPLDANGVVSPTGVTQFVVGTAGNWISPFGGGDTRVASGYDTTATAWGALKLGLSPAGATYQFQTIAGQTGDFGSASCQGASDTTAPTTPTQPAATGISGREVDLTWTASTDDVGVTSYQILRNGVALATVPGYQTAFADTTANASTSYTYAVVANDTAGNHSPVSATTSASTPAAAPTFVQSGTAATSTRVTSTSVALGKPVRAGDLLVGWFGQYDAAGQVQVSDDVNGAWTRAQGEPFTSGSGDAALYYVKAGSAAPNGVTVTASAASATYLNAAVGDYYGTSAAGPLLATAVGAGSGTAADSGGSAAVPGGSLVFAAVMTGGSPGTVTAGKSAGVPIVSRSSVASQAVVAADVLSSAAGSQHAAFTLGTATDWYAGAAVFRPPSTGDTTAPTVPAGVTAGAAGGSVTVRWTAATDAVGVAGYTVYRNGTALGDAPPGQLSYSDTTTAPATSYDYTVAAYDAAGNRSAQSTPAHVDTPAAAPSYVQSGTVTTGARASAATLPLAKPVAAGDLLVGWFGQYDAAGQVQVSDSVNGAWTRVQGETFTSGNGDVGLYYVKSAAATAGVTVKVGATVATYLQGAAADYGGATPPGPLVGSAVGSGNSSTADSGATPVAASGALVVTALMTGGSPGASVPQASTPGATPVVRSATASGSVAIADLLGAAPGAQRGAFALTASTDWYSMAAVFGP